MNEDTTTFKRMPEKMNIETVDEKYEEIATGIFNEIENLKRSFSAFEWHGDRRDERLFTLKITLDQIWDRVRNYRNNSFEDYVSASLQKEM